MIRIAQSAILCLVALALGLLAQSIWARPEPFSIESDQAVIAAANRYFAAVDSFLTSGDDRALRDTIGVDFADWTSGNQTAAEFEAYRAQLENVRALFPGLRLQQTILGVGDQIMTARLNPVTDESVRFAGIQITAADLLGDTEILRFARGRLIARWEMPRVRGTFDSYPGAPVGGPVGVTLERWSLDPHDPKIAAQGIAPVALLVEQGRIQIDLVSESSRKATLWSSSGQQQPVAAPATLDLTAGSALCLPFGAIGRIQASENRPATLLALFLVRPTSGDIHHPSEANAPPGDRLDPGGEIALVGSSTEIEIGAMHLEQGSELEIDPTSGSILLLLELGSADLRGIIRTELPFMAGEAHVVSAASSAHLRITSPGGAELYLVHLAPSIVADESTCVRLGGDPRRPRDERLCST